MYRLFLFFLSKQLSRKFGYDFYVDPDSVFAPTKVSQILDTVFIKMVFEHLARLYQSSPHPSNKVPRYMSTKELASDKLILLFGTSN